MQVKSKTDYCRLLRENLYAYRENELPVTLKEQLDDHVSRCKECSSLVVQFDGVHAAVKQQAAIEPRPFAETRLQQRVENYLENRPASLFSFSARSLLQPAVISLGLMLALAIGILIGTEKAGRNTAPGGVYDQEIRSELNVPESSADDLLNFTE